MLKLMRLLSFGALTLLVAPAPAGARVVSYAPITARNAVPAVQSRLDRRFLLIERTGFSQGLPPGSPTCLACGWPQSRLVLYDSAGLDEPRDVSPGGGASAISFAASFEDGGAVRLLAVSNAPLPGEAPQIASRLLFSADSGGTWAPVALPAGLHGETAFVGSLPDRGGWFVRERGSNVRLGTSDTPFVALLPDDNAPSGGWGLVGIGKDGTARLLATGQGQTLSLFGSDSDLVRFLVVADAIQPGPGCNCIIDVTKTGLFAVDLAGNVTPLADLASSNLPGLYAWMAADGSTYLQYDSLGGVIALPFTAPRSVGVARGGVFTELVTANGDDGTTLFAVPSAYYRGTWILKRDAGPTVLMSHGPKQGLLTHWSDVTRPEVEALHVSLTGLKLLVQVHRPRLTPERRFVDPALALWAPGTPAPARYDELFLNEQPTKGFVHLEVDAVSDGSPFFFDSGLVTTYPPNPGGPSGGAGGGADVVQEWGVVQGSLRQQLVIPASAHTGGVFGSTWRTDLILRNGDDTPLPVSIRLLPNPDTGDVTPEASLTLAPGEIRLVPDALNALFGLEKGAGALLITPEAGRSVDATSRTYSESEKGSFGMGIGAVDLFATASPNFPVTFSAALLGPGFRTNFVATDASGRGSRLSLSVAPVSADLPVATFGLDAPDGKQRQLNGLAAAAGFPDGSRGSLLLSPARGAVIAGLIAIDNLTNDPTWFTPDLPATVPRTIPALVHAEGAGGAPYRSDLYLFNPTDETRWVTLQVRDWLSPQTVQSLSLTLLPNESKVVRDALFTAFGLTGVAQMSFFSASSPTSVEGVRATSRTYTTGSDGGTYGHPVPPLNSFQSVTGGETLQILGPVAAAGFRTNLALVDLLPPGNLTTPLTIRVEILDAGGRIADSFTTPLPPGSGVQLNDLFNARGLPADLGPVLIRVSPSGGNVAAYATTVDNGTNDPTYFQAVLAASE